MFYSFIFFVNSIVSTFDLVSLGLARLSHASCGLVGVALHWAATESSG